MVQIAVADTLVALADLGMVVVAWVGWATLGNGPWHFSPLEWLFHFNVNPYTYNIKNVISI